MLGYRQYLVKVGSLETAEVYDIFDAETGEQVGVARENPGGLINALRLIVDKRQLPTKVEIKEDKDSDPILTLRRPVAFFSREVHVLGDNGSHLGYFKSKFFTFGSAFNVFNAKDEHVATVKGDWKGRNFRFLTVDDEEIGFVSKQWSGKWSGIAKLFNRADSYVVSLNGEPSQAKVALLLAAGLAIDLIHKADCRG